MSENTLWEQKPGETDVAFAAFRCYRDMGPRRSLDQVGRALYEGQGGRIRGTTGRLQLWSVTWRWVERARAWDAELDRQAREAQIAAVKAMHSRHASESVEFQNKSLERLRQLPLEELVPADVLRYYVEAVKIERLARGEPETIHEQRQKGQPDSDSLTRLVLTDPRAADLACELFERVATRQDQPGGTSVVREPEAMAAGAASQPAEPETR